MTVIGACACCKVAGLANTVSNADGAVDATYMVALSAYALSATM